MVKALFDTTVLIDYLNGVESARVERARFDGRCISVISWVEVMVGTTPADAGVNQGIPCRFRAFADQ